jgi:hypothetical protein
MTGAGRIRQPGEWSKVLKSSARWIGWRRGNRDGFALPAGLFALIIVTVLVFAAVQLGDNERRATRALRASGVALYAAESGLAATVGNWPAGVAALNPGDSLNLGWTTLSDRGMYRAVIHRMDAGTTTKVYAIMVEARGAGALGGRASLTRMVTTVVTPGNGFVALGALGVNTGNTVDSYTSTGCADPSIDGCYSSTHDSSATLLAGGAVDVHGTFTYGSISSGSTINTAGAVVTGTVSPSLSPNPVPPASYPTAACPAAYTPLSDVIPLTAATYNASTGQLVLASSGTQVLDDTPSAGYYYFDLLKVATHLNISYSATPVPVTIYVHDKLVVSSGGDVNNLTKKPGLLTIKSCLQAGDPSTFGGHGFSLTGGAAAYFQIYAPNMDVTVGGTGGGLWGSIVGLTIDVTGSANIHYDKALGPGAGAALSMLTGSWAELQPF